VWGRTGAEGGGGVCGGGPALKGEEGCIAREPRCPLTTSRGEIPNTASAAHRTARRARPSGGGGGRSLPALPLRKLSTDGRAPDGGVDKPDPGAVRVRAPSRRRGVPGPSSGPSSPGAKGGGAARGRSPGVPGSASPARRSEEWTK
jgi:hypothetical protein